MKRYAVSIIFVLSIISTVLVACGGAASPAPPFEASAPVEMPEAAPAEPSREMVVEGEMDTVANSSATEFREEDILQDRKVIYNANMGLIVADTEASSQKIQELVDSMGGYVANMNAYRGGENALFYNITVRVPAAQFDATRAALREMAIRVENESINTDDVTDQYYDLDARLRTLRATEEELLALLKETRERGGKVEDIMSIYRELANIQSQIESLQGQLNRLDKLVALSTIDIFLQTDVLNQPISTSWRPLETLRNSFETLINALQGLMDMFIYVLVVILPVLLILALPVIVVLLVLRWFIRRRNLKKTQSP